MGWVVSFTPWPLYPCERPGTHCIWGWVGRRAGLDAFGKSHPHRDSENILQPYFEIIFSSSFFFESMFIWFRDKKILLFKSLLVQLWRMKNIIFFWEQILFFFLERQCEWNWPALWLFLEIVACYLNCLDPVVRARSLWVLAVFPLCFSVLGFLGQSNYIKKNPKKHPCCIMIILCHRSCQRTSTK